MSLVKNIFLFFCTYKIYLRSSAEGYKNAGVDPLIIKKKKKKMVKFGQK